MKKIVLTKNSTPIMIDTETMDVNAVDSQREAIRSIHKIEEDCTIKQDDNEIEAHAGDLLITFWESDFSKKFILVNCKEWYDMLTEYNDLMQKRKEEWAKSDSKTCDGCNNCICESKSID